VKLAENSGKMAEILIKSGQGEISMETFVIIDRDTLPETIFSYIKSEKIKIFEENGNIVLSPVGNKPNVNELFGMFNDGKLSSNDFINQKIMEMDKEN
jgi:hypothetical protein